jgi:hypothetical protein
MLSASITLAQPEAVLTFEVASIRPAEPQRYPAPPEYSPGGRLAATNTVFNFIQQFYDVRE